MQYTLYKYSVCRKCDTTVLHQTIADTRSTLVNSANFQYYCERFLGVIHIIVNSRPPYLPWNKPGYEAIECHRGAERSKPLVYEYQHNQLLMKSAIHVQTLASCYTCIMCTK